MLSKHNAMKVVFTHSFALSGCLKIGSRSIPQVPSAFCKSRSSPVIPLNLSSNLVLIKCVASAVNRGDLLQRRGKYPAPKSENPLTQESDVCGLEASGYVVDKGSKVSNLDIGDPVMVLLTGGGYGEYVLVDESVVISVKKYLKTGSGKNSVKNASKFLDPHFKEKLVPKISELNRLRLIYASCLPEVYLTAFQCLFTEHPNGGVKSGDTVLIHSGASGVGLAAIRLCRAFGALPHVSVRSSEKATACKALGALYVYNFSAPQDKYDTNAFDPMPQNDTINFVLDTVFGSNYFEKSIPLLKIDGVYTVISFLGGCKIPENIPGTSELPYATKKSSISFAQLLIKRNKIIFTTLRNRSIAYKKHLIKEFQAFLKENKTQISLEPIWTKEIGKTDYEKSPNQTKSSTIWVRPIVYESIPFLSDENQRTVRKMADSGVTNYLLDAHNVHKAHNKLEKNETVGKVILHW